MKQDSLMTTFNDMNLLPELQKVLTEMGFETPTEIQAAAIPVINKTKKDFVGQAQTGTGKTIAFAVPLLTKVDGSKNNIQAIVLAPTRELATQVESEIKKLAKYLDIKTACIYGGTAYEKQIKALRSDKPQIVVGTPGRVIDLIKKNELKLDQASFCVLDEADEMLNMGFFDDVELILSKFKLKKQLMMFSATMPKPILKLIEKSFNDHDIVQIEKKSLSNDDIEQKYFIVRDKHFKEGLARLIDAVPEMYGIVFCRTKLETKEVGDNLKKRGHNVEVLNGDMGQVERDVAMNNFKKKRVNILVCTDVAARGIDVDSLTHVFNYGLPRDNESYVHRIGRTGRAGMKGSAYTLVGPKSVHAIKSIENHIKNKIILAKLPSIEELKRRTVEKELDAAKYILSAIQTKGDDFKTEPSFDLFLEQFGHLSQAKLLKVMFVWKFNKDMRHYNNLSDIEGEQDNRGPKPLKRERIRNVGGKKSGSGKGRGSFSGSRSKRSFK
jgi:ATP-dependent RNA helicase DeaD